MACAHARVHHLCSPQFLRLLVPSLVDTGKYCSSTLITIVDLLGSLHDARILRVGSVKARCQLQPKLAKRELHRLAADTVYANICMHCHNLSIFNLLMWLHTDPV